MTLIDDMQDVFALATSATAFVNELLKIKNTKNKSKQNDNGEDSSKLASSGYSSKLASSGYYSKLASSGDYSKLASSGYSSKLASSGDYSKLASSGDSSKLEVKGQHSVAAAIGYKNIVKAVKGTWVTLAEYDNEGKVKFVKTEQIDGERLKEDCFYTLYNSEFHEVQEIDGVLTIVFSRKRNITKGLFLNDYAPCYVFEKDGVYAHGKTIKQAYRDWLFKTSDRDVSQYENIDKNEEKELNYWIIAYRTITGACSFGTENYLENNKEKYKDKMTLNEVIKATEGQYGHNTFKEFFRV